MHHLEENPDGNSFPVIRQMLKEVNRILKPGGVLTIISITPEQLDAYWLSSLVPQNTKQWHKRLLSFEQLKSSLSEAKFDFKSAFHSHTTSYYPEYSDPEGPLNETWRENIGSGVFWETCSEEEIRSMIQNVTRMKKEGTFSEFQTKHDKTNIYGVVNICAAKKGVQQI